MRVPFGKIALIASVVLPMPAHAQTQQVPAFLKTPHYFVFQCDGAGHFMGGGRVDPEPVHAGQTNRSVSIPEYAIGQEYCVPKNWIPSPTGAFTPVHKWLSEDTNQFIHLTGQPTHIRDGLLKIPMPAQQGFVLDLVKPVSPTKKPSDHFSLHYPFATPFAHINSKNYSTAGAERVIRDAVDAGGDPYLALSIALMESGSEDLHEIYLYASHDRHKIRGLGLSTTEVENANKKILPAPWADEARLRNFLVKRGTKVIDKKPSYICVSKQSNKIRDFGGVDWLYSLPSSFAICQQLSFSTPDFSNLSLRTFLVQNYIRKLSDQDPSLKDDLPASLAGRKDLDPEHLIQNFQSYSTNTGTGMVSMIAPYRLGTNSVKTPSYGIQALDYYHQTILSSDAVQSMVNRISKSEAPRTLACKGLPEGIYAQADDLGVEQTGGMVRFGDLAAKAEPLVKRNKSEAIPELAKIFNELPRGSGADGRRPILKELATPAVQNKLGIYLTMSEKSQLSRASDASEDGEPEIDSTLIGKALYFYFRDVYASRTTSWQTSNGDNPRKTWDRIEN